MRLSIVSVVPLEMKLDEPPCVPTVPFAVKAPPVGAVASACAVNVVPAFVLPALFVAVTAPDADGEVAPKL